MVETAIFRSFPRVARSNPPKEAAESAPVTAVDVITAPEGLSERFTQELRTRRQTMRDALRDGPDAPAATSPEAYLPPPDIAQSPVVASHVATAPPPPDAGLSVQDEPSIEAGPDQHERSLEDREHNGADLDVSPEPLTAREETPPVIPPWEHADSSPVAPPLPVAGVSVAAAEPLADADAPGAVFEMPIAAVEPIHEPEPEAIFAPEPEAIHEPEPQAMLEPDPQAIPEPEPHPLYAEPEIDPPAPVAPSLQPATRAPQHFRSESLRADYQLLGLASPLVCTVIGRLGDSDPTKLSIGRTGIYRPEGYRAAPWTGFAYDVSRDGRAGIMIGASILTARGEVPVEELVPGDCALALRGPALLPIAWIGRSIASAPPVQIDADAFGPGRPAKTLRVGADHLIFMQTDPMPAHALVNGSSIHIFQEETELFHIDVGSPEVLLVEGIPVASGRR